MSKTVMNVEGLDKVVLNVKDLKDAERFFGQLLDTEFKDTGPARHEIGKGIYKASICPLGLELLEQLEPPLTFRDSAIASIRSFHLRVADIHATEEELRKKGFLPIEKIQLKGIRELVYEILGVRTIFLEYNGKFEL